MKATDNPYLMLRRSHKDGEPGNFLERFFAEQTDACLLLSRPPLQQERGPFFWRRSHSAPREQSHGAKKVPLRFGFCCEHDRTGRGLWATKAMTLV